MTTPPKHLKILKSAHKCPNLTSKELSFSGFGKKAKWCIMMKGAQIQDQTVEIKSGIGGSLQQKVCCLW
jgi:hypothetical protein